MNISFSLAGALKRFKKSLAVVIALGITTAVALVWFARLQTPASADSHYDFHFTASGDFGGEDEAAEDTLALISAAASSFHLALGDLAYEEYSSEAEWCSFVTGIVGSGFPFELLSGNHEDSPDPYVIDDYVGCLPHQDSLGPITGAYGKEYYFDYPSGEPLVRTILISPNLNFSGDSEGAYSYTSGAHRDWLEDAIDGARSAGIPWVVVGMHENCISVGEKSCTIGEALMDMLIDRRVDVIVQAHDHTYQRSKQLTCVDTETTTIGCVADDGGAESVYTKGNGSVLVIAGTGGKDLYNVNSSDSDDFVTSTGLDAEEGYFVRYMGANSADATYGVVKFSIAPDELKGEFIPIASGDFADSFTIVGEGPTTTPRGPINAVVVLDRSYSMNQDAGGRTKMEALQPAADLFVNLLRDDLTEAGTSHRLGMVRYNHTSTEYLALDDIDDDAHFADAIEKVSVAAIEDSARLIPSGSTSIGGGMERAAGMLVGTEASRPHVMVVFTDGKDNTDPRIEDVFDSIVAADDQLRIYSVGLGSGDDIDPLRLEMIANVTNGDFYTTDALLTEGSRFALQEFFFKIFANSTGWELADDPTVLVPLTGTEPRVIHRAVITSSDSKATFLVLDDPAMRKLYTLELVAPNGTVIQPREGVTDLGVRYLQRYNYALYRFTIPQGNTSYIGEWKLRLTPDSDHPALANIAEPVMAPIGFAAAVVSDYKMDAQVNRKGKKITATATLTHKGKPVVGAEVFAAVTDPLGKLREVMLYDNGVGGDRKAGDGVYTAHITAAVKGSYRFSFISDGKNEQGQSVHREAMQFTYVPGPNTSVVMWGWIAAFLIVLILLCLLCCKLRHYFIGAVMPRNRKAAR